MERYIRILGLFILSICCGLFVISTLPGCDFMFVSDPCPYDPDPNCGQDTSYNEAYGNSSSVSNGYSGPELKLPLPGGYNWGVNTVPGSYYTHMGDDYYSIDFDDDKEGDYDENGNPQGDLGEGEVDVLAAAGGYATVHPNYGAYGNAVIIDHGNGYTTIYGHLYSFTISNGEVSQGQILGKLGNTGNSDGPHVHFQIQYDGDSSSDNEQLIGVTVEGILFVDYEVGEYYLSTNYEIDCTDYSSEINAVKSEYGSFIGNEDGVPHVYGSGSDICIQDYDDTGTSDGTSAILFDSENGARQAYLVRSGFWAHYSFTCGGPAGDCDSSSTIYISCGAPINDEYYNGVDSLTGYGSARQDFQGCYLYWNGSSASANPYPYAAPGWTNNGWNSTYSYAFAEAYERNGARNDMGEATDVVDGANVHHWGDNSNLPLVQDFDDGSFGWCVIMYNESKNEAYAIHTGFWDYYNNAGPGTHGAPCNDEYSVWGGARQDFENTTLKWNGSAVSTGPNNGCSSSSPSGNSGLDWDWDGWTTEQGDCNDASNGVYPGHPEIYDGVDNDCDGQIDEGLSNPADSDGDGQTPAEGDCNDSNPNVYYGAPEICGNNVDDDCVGGDVPCSELYCADNADNDLDGYVDCNDPDCASNSACAPPAPDYDLDNDGQNAVAYGGQDCNDANASVYYGAPEICGNGVDNDCVGGDVPCSELYCFDNIDNDLDGLVDCDDPNCNAAIVCQPPPPDYDLDNDGQNGVAYGGQDCNDSNANVYYGAFEICGNGINDDCIGGDVPCSEQYCADNADNDFDGYTDCNDPDCTSNSACVVPTPADYDGDGYPDSTECGWWSANIYPGAPELADWVDNDCDGVVDDGCTWGCNGSYWNNCHDDFETYYTTGSLTFVCTGVYIPRITDTDGDGYEDSVDCAYWDPTTYPGAPERSDWNDNDCDGTTDEGCNDICMGNYAGGCHDDYEWYYLSSAPSAPICGP